MYLFVKIVFAVMGFTMCLGGEAINSSRALYDHLFNSTHHTPDVIPICKKGDKVTVSVDLALRELVELNEKFQILRLKIWLRLKWKDCVMTWRPEEYDGQEHIIVPYGKVWMPDLALYEGSSDEANMPDMKEYKVSIKYNGEVSYNFPTIVTSACRIDVTYFPYDYQNCSLTFSSWIYSGAEVDLTTTSPSADTENFVHHNEWALASMNSTRLLRHYKCCPDPYPNIIYHLVLARFPKFYLLTLFFPCIIVSLLSLLGFILPPGQGEKISLQITILLTIVVFLLLVQDKLPSSSDTFPYIGIYFSVSMILVCASCVMSGIVMYIFYKGSTREPVPSWAKKIFLDVLRPLLCVSPTGIPIIKDDEEHENNVIIRDIKHSDEQKHLEEEHLNAPHSNGIGLRSLKVSVSSNDIPHYTDADTEDLHDRKTVKNEWILLAFVLDRFFLILYVVFTLSNTISFFVLMNQELDRF